jgi:hypothetical protein
MSMARMPIVCSICFRMPSLHGSAPKTPILSGSSRTSTPIDAAVSAISSA